MVFCEDKTHLEDCPNGRVEELQAVKVDMSPKLDMEDLDVSSNVSEQDEEPDMEEDAEADVPAAKSTRSGEVSKLDHGKKIATKPPPPLQYGNKTMDNSRYLDRPRKPLGEW